MRRLHIALLMAIVLAVGGMALAGPPEKQIKKQPVVAAPRAERTLAPGSSDVAKREKSTRDRTAPDDDIRDIPIRDLLPSEPATILEETVEPEPKVLSTGTAAAINLDWVSVNHGGAIEIGSGPFRMGVSIGQTVAGYVESGPYQMGLGFWYGAAGAPQDCACDCFGDPRCDSIINDIFDIVEAANVAFRFGPPLPDPNPLCPRTRTDVNCDGATNIFDIVKFADVAFRFVSPSVAFCDPCALSASLHAIGESPGP